MRQPTYRYGFGEGDTWIGGIRLGIFDGHKHCSVILLEPQVKRNEQIVSCILSFPQMVFDLNKSTKNIRKYITIFRLRKRFLLLQICKNVALTRFQRNVTDQSNDLTFSSRCWGFRQSINLLLQPN